MKQKIVLGMSGGVDSTLAAVLLQKQGYEVVGFFMNCDPHGTSNLPSSIDWDKEERDLRKICKRLGIELVMLDCEIGYREKVIGKMVEDYKKGLTPNPDTLCNKIGKFPKLLKLAKEIGAERIATGHYARVRRGRFGFELLRGKDKEKDQSYFLCDLNQQILSKCVLPLGELTKVEVRKLVKKNGFKNWDKRSSRGICYLGKIDVKKFLKSKISEKKGKVVSHEGEVVGRHPGAMYYTIGERVRDKTGFEIDKDFRKKYPGKLFVSRKERGNRIVVAPEGHKLLKTRKIWIKGFRWINIKDQIKEGLRGRIRHLGNLESGKLKKEKGRWTFIFDKGQEGVAAGQSIVLYSREKMVASGEIRLR